MKQRIFYFTITISIKLIENSIVQTNKLFPVNITAINNRAMDCVYITMTSQHGERVAFAHARRTRSFAYYVKCARKMSHHYSVDL